MQKVCCFGEVLLRLSPDTGGAWIDNNQLTVHVGGAELNVATALAKWQVDVKYVSAVPDNYVCRHIVQRISKKGIDTTDFIYSGNRIGTYYLPPGIDLKAAGVIYDRAHSAFYELKPGQADWDKILKDVSWLHFSAITPALSQSVADVCLEMVKAARQKNITVSIDLNYRAKLWKYGKEPGEIIPELTKYCNVVMGNLWAAEQMLGIEIDSDLKRDRQSLLQHAEKTSQAIMVKYPGCKVVANTFRLDNATPMSYYAALYKNGKLYASKQHAATEIVDKIGSGDCFMAALIFGSLKEWEAQQMIDFAAAAAFDKLFIAGDATTSTVDQIKQRL